MWTRPGRVRWIFLSFVALAACGEDPSGPNSAPVATVELSPLAAMPAVGQTVQLTVTLKTAAGTVVTGRTINWKSSAEAVASVSASGLLTAVAAGQADITATADGVSDTVTVTVTPDQAASCTDCLEVVPGTLLLSGVGAQQQLTAFLVDAKGQRTAVAATFESSNPSVMTVTPAGLVTAAANLGSSQVTARVTNSVGARTSAPVLALVAQPVAGALLVSDAQVVGAITPVDSAAPYALGYKYRVRLRGAAAGAPAVGQVVLGTGSSPVGGRVVSVADAGSGLKDVVLELLPIDEMFAAISVNQQIPLDEAASAVSPAVAQAFIVERLPGGNLRFTSRGRMVPTDVRALPRMSVSAPGVNEFKFNLGSLSCEAKVEGALSVPMILDAFSFDINPSLTYDVVIADRKLQRAVAHGGITTTISSDLLINAAVTGSVECKKEVKKLILPIGGWIAFIVGGHVPIEVGLALEAKVELDSIGYDAFFQATVATALGLDCTGGCQAVGDVTSNAGGFFKPRLPASFDELRTKLTASGFVSAALKIGNPFIEELQFKVAELKVVVLEQKAELASEKGQTDDAAYAASFSLAGPSLRAGTTSDIEALKGLKIEIPALSFALDGPTLAHSPVGTFTISPATVAPGDDTKLGDMATFTVTLDPVTYFGFDAVERVEIRWLKKDATGAMVLVPGRPGCTTLTAASGQKVFTCQTDFLAADTGVQTFYAFVKAKLFGVPVPLLLELGPNAVATVRVGVSAPIAFNFDCECLDGWISGATGNGTVAVVQGAVKLDGTGEPGLPNAWISRTIAIPPGMTTLTFDVRGHNREGADARLIVRIVEGGVSQTILDQIVTGAEGITTFSARQLNISAWAGKTVQIFFEQDDNGFQGAVDDQGRPISAHEQIYLDNISIQP